MKLTNLKEVRRFATLCRVLTFDNEDSIFNNLPLKLNPPHPPFPESLLTEQHLQFASSFDVMMVINWQNVSYSMS